MTLTHSEIITARAKNLGNLTTNAELKITNDILSESARRMNSKLGYQAYGNYVRMFTENVYDSTTEYHLLKEGQKKLRDLEAAESYYTLYFLALALRKLEKGSVMTKETIFGEGTIKPSPYIQIIEMQDTYKRQGDRIINQYGSGGISVMVV